MCWQDTPVGGLALDAFKQCYCLQHAITRNAVYLAYRATTAIKRGVVKQELNKIW